MRIIITGATGYIGSNLTKALMDLGHDVFVVSRPTSKYELLDRITQGFETERCYKYDGKIDNLISFFCKIQPQIVIHLATLFIAEHDSKDVKNLVDSNILFITEILEASAKSGCKYIINTSTSWQYYCNDVIPSCLYAATKKAAEDILVYYADAYGMTGINITIFDSYGPNDPRRKIINILRNLVLDETPSTIDMTGGEQIMELVYIDDIVNAYVQAMGIIENYSAGSVYSFFLHAVKQYTLKEIVRLFEKTSGVSLNIIWGGRPYRKREVMIPYSGGDTLPGWMPKVELEEGIRRILL